MMKKKFLLADQNDNFSTPNHCKPRTQQFKKFFLVSFGFLVCFLLVLISSERSFLPTKIVFTNVPSSASPANSQEDSPTKKLEKLKNHLPDLKKYEIKKIGKQDLTALLTAPSLPADYGELSREVKTIFDQLTSQQKWEEEIIAMINQKKQQTVWEKIKPVLVQMKAKKITKVVKISTKNILNQNPKDHYLNLTSATHKELLNLAKLSDWEIKLTELLRNDQQPTQASEKSFFQKYWPILLGGGLLALVAICFLIFSSVRIKKQVGKIK